MLCVRQGDKEIVLAACRQDRNSARHFTAPHLRGEIATSGHSPAARPNGAGPEGGGRGEDEEGVDGREDRESSLEFNGAAREGVTATSSVGSGDGDEGGEG